MIEIKIKIAKIYYLFYKGIKGKRLNMSLASTNPADIVGLFAPDSSITSQYLCFVYRYKASDNQDWIYVGKMINKKPHRFILITMMKLKISLTIKLIIKLINIKK